MQKLIDEIMKTSGDMDRRGWAESNGGNISQCLNPENYEYFNGLHGDNARPDAFKEFAEKLEKNGIDYERVIQPETKHNLGLYY